MPIGLYREVPLRLERGPAELEGLLRALGRQPPDDPSSLENALLDAAWPISPSAALGSEDGGEP